MALSWSAVLDHNIARTSVAQRRQLPGSFAGSVLSQPRGIRRPRGFFSRWTRGFAPHGVRVQRVSSSSSGAAVGCRAPGGDVPSMRAPHLDALAAVRVAVLADFAHRGLVLPDPVACDTST